MTVNPKYGGPLISPDLLCNAYQIILTEEMCKSTRGWMEAFYTDKGQSLAGLKQEEL